MIHSDSLFDYLKSVLVSCGLPEASVRYAHKINILKVRPSANVSLADENLTQDVDLVGVNRTKTTETRYIKTYDRTVEFAVELVHKTAAEAEHLALDFITALPTRKTINDIRVMIKAEKLQRKTFEKEKLIAIKDAKAVVIVEMTVPVIRSSERQTISEIDITPRYTEVLP